MRQLPCFRTIFLLVTLLASATGHLFPQASLETKHLKLYISRGGQVKGLAFQPFGKDYLAESQSSPLLQVMVHGIWESPVSATYHPASETVTSGILDLFYTGSNVRIKIRTEIHATYIVFEIIRAEPGDKIERVLWGPYATIISKTVGEVIGVVRDDDFSIGLQVLNEKTLGGYPANAQGSDTSRGTTAEKAGWGSQLQAYTLNRSLPQTIGVWWDQFPDMPLKPIPGETVTGSKIAIFGCPADRTLEIIGDIEKQENLPHPLIGADWSKTSLRPCRSYLVADYSEETIDEFLHYTRQAGLMTLYHMNAWRSWGHYKLDTSFFPHGAIGFRKCLAKATDMKIWLGANTLTDFINTTDPYVIPVIDGSSQPGPFYWHINSYLNWGEPWKGGFTESMQEYRIANQDFFERNFLPHMLGWYLLTDSTTLEEMEWMLARAAGYNAGFALATSLESLRKNPHTGELLDAIREWEYCRLNGLFPPELIPSLKDPSREFHLEKKTFATWDLYPLERTGESKNPKTGYRSGKPVRLYRKGTE